MPAGARQFGRAPLRRFRATSSPWTSKGGYRVFNSCVVVVPPNGAQESSFLRVHGNPRSLGTRPSATSSPNELAVAPV